jgi:hypothetical protein
MSAYNIIWHHQQRCQVWKNNFNYLTYATVCSTRNWNMLTGNDAHNMLGLDMEAFEGNKLNLTEAYNQRSSVLISLACIINLTVECRAWRSAPVRKWVCEETTWYFRYTNESCSTGLSIITNSRKVMNREITHKAIVCNIIKGCQCETGARGPELKFSDGRESCNFFWGRYFHTIPYQYCLCRTNLSNFRMCHKLLYTAETNSDCHKCQI